MDYVSLSCSNLSQSHWIILILSPSILSQLFSFLIYVHISLCPIFFLNHLLHVCLSHLICFSLYMYSHLVSNLLIPPPSLHFSLFSLSLPSPFFSYLFLSLAFFYYYSLLILLYSYHSFNSFFLSIVLSNSRSLCCLPLFLPLPLYNPISLGECTSPYAFPSLFFLLHPSLYSNISLSLSPYFLFEFFSFPLLISILISFYYSILLSQSCLFIILLSSHSL